jgi:hypothetical protein
LAAVTFFAALPFILLAAYLRIRYEIQFEGMNAAVYANSSRFATEAIHAFRTVSALTMEDSIVQRYSDLLHQQQIKAMRKAWYATLIFAFSDSIDLCAMALTFWLVLSCSLFPLHDCRGYLPSDIVQVRRPAACVERIRSRGILCCVHCHCTRRPVSRSVL